MARKTRRPLWLKLVLALLIVAPLALGAWLYLDLRTWQPPESEYPEQGADLSAANDSVNFAVLAGQGADFVYLPASSGAAERSGRFTRDMAAARAAGLEVGAVHRFDPCVPADGQSANFVTIVPRDETLLPPAIALVDTGEDCIEPVASGQVRSELTILANQIEAHAGRPAILKVSREFEDAHGVAARIERNLWLVRTRFEPDYGGRPWLIWTANEKFHSGASEQPVAWAVVRP
ncbi:glycoside hydrolase family 25 protein [Alteriqipengyuania lutimaris]|uniref:Lysozyme n=1 Tax=Alteriqipengyuania lutimaris TaxID=1538146 RepID=A0A395LJE0_9SPHN|nr:glycoside hydrolase family 25 protein [Alteriqipengyuania lutimaris]MBB3034728.1 lysozyme [Alteriqipengyuania lutimaris]RDS76417.1 lysozyme [Alteriqipengyuania lutimaris]